MRTNNQKGAVLVESLISLFVFISLFGGLVQLCQLLYYRLSIPMITYEFLVCEEINKIDCRKIFGKSVNGLLILSKIVEFKHTRSRTHSSAKIKILTPYGITIGFNESISLPLFK